MQRAKRGALVMESAPSKYLPQVFYIGVPFTAHWSEISHLATPSYDGDRECSFTFLAGIGTAENQGFVVRHEERMDVGVGNITWFCVFITC